MRGTSTRGVTEWLEFDDPADDKRRFSVNLNFMASNWSCIFGKGCPGIFGAGDAYTLDDVGCCHDGVYFENKQDFDHTADMVKQLTDEDWDATLSRNAMSGGWYRKAPYADLAAEDAPYKTRVFQRGCIFSNRANGTVGNTGKTGCAFHHLAARTGQDVTDVKPTVCWTDPLRVVEEDEDDGSRIVTIRAWDSDDWNTNENFDGDDHEDVVKWFCTDTPDAYLGTSAVIHTMEHELRKIMGDVGYEFLREEVLRRFDVIPPMYAQEINDGRPLLPLIVGNRTPMRVTKEHKEKKNG